MINPRMVLRMDIGMPKRTTKRNAGGYETPKRRAKASMANPTTRMFFRITVPLESISPTIRLRPGDRIHGG